MKPLALAMGAAFVTSLAGASVANAAENPFGMTELPSGYMVADSDMKEGKCGGSMKEGMKEGKCGGEKAKKMKEGKCGEGKCGGEKAKKMKEGKCGEGKCGEGMMKGAEKMKEGKCGEGMSKDKMKEGKCGGSK